MGLTLELFPIAQVYQAAGCDRAQIVFHQPPEIVHRTQLGIDAEHLSTRWVFSRLPSTPLPLRRLKKEYIQYGIESAGPVRYNSFFRH